MKKELIILLISLVLISGCTASWTKKAESAPDKAICENAQANNLCDTLDVTFAEGYKELCCNELGKCC